VIQGKKEEQRGVYPDQLKDHPGDGRGIVHELGGGAKKETVREKKRWEVGEGKG